MFCGHIAAGRSWTWMPFGQFFRTTTILNTAYHWAYHFVAYLTIFAENPRDSYTSIRCFDDLYSYKRIIFVNKHKLQRLFDGKGNTRPWIWAFSDTRWASHFQAYRQNLRCSSYNCPCFFLRQICWTSYWIFPRCCCPESELGEQA